MPCKSCFACIRHVEPLCASLVTVRHAPLSRGATWRGLLDAVLCCLVFLQCHFSTRFFERLAQNPPMRLTPVFASLDIAATGMESSPDLNKLKLLNYKLPPC